MSFNAAKLKKKAAEFEQKKQFDKALQLYIQILDESPGDDEADVALYNRVGDLLMREGRPSDAMAYYEKAVDLYAESGFFNNAIALCNKILRQSPGRNSIYYKLGKISAKKGFISDAKQNFLEYADRMQKAEQLDEAFRALKEFADLCPDQDDIRLMLADQLSKKGRTAEAIDQLQHLYDKFEVEGRGADMRATVDRMKAIDANAEPQTGRGPRQKKSSDLVFLDLGDGAPAPPRRSGPGQGASTAASARTPTPTFTPALSPTLAIPVIEPPPPTPAPDATFDTPSGTAGQAQRDHEREAEREQGRESEGASHRDSECRARARRLGSSAGGADSGDRGGSCRPRYGYGPGAARGRTHDARTVRCGRRCYDASTHGVRAVLSRRRHAGACTSTLAARPRAAVERRRVRGAIAPHAFERRSNRAARARSRLAWRPSKSGRSARAARARATPIVVDR